MNNSTVYHEAHREAHHMEPMGIRMVYPAIFQDVPYGASRGVHDVIKCLNVKLRDVSRWITWHKPIECHKSWYIPWDHEPL